MTSAINRIKGQVVYFYAIDVAYDMVRTPIRSVLGHPVAAVSPSTERRAPREEFFYKPMTVKLPAQEGQAPWGRVSIQRELRLFTVGAISIRCTVAFEVDSLARLNRYESLLVDGLPLQSHVLKLAGQVSEELASVYIDRVARPRIDESYTTFCIESPGVLDGLSPDAVTWLRNNAPAVAGLLNFEPNPDKLSTLEIQDTLGRPLSYYRHDLAVLDWEVGLLLDEPGQFEPALHIIELANVQLAELGAYDRLLDAGLQRAYRDLSAGGILSRSRILTALRELRVDLARLSDEMSNTTKFIGDWHVARLYQCLSERYHLADWRRTVDEKQKTLDELYQILKQDRINVWMMVLEVAIVALFVIEVVRIFVTGAG